MPYYLIKDANGKAIGQIASYKDIRKPNSFQLEPDLDLAKANADLIVLTINQAKAESS